MSLGWIKRNYNIATTRIFGNTYLKDTGQRVVVRERINKFYLTIFLMTESLYVLNNDKKNNYIPIYI